MTPERWRQVDDLLQSALECEPNEREAFLNHYSIRSDPRYAELLRRMGLPPSALHSHSGQVR